MKAWKKLGGGFLMVHLSCTGVIGKLPIVPSAEALEPIYIKHFENNSQENEDQIFRFYSVGHMFIL